MSLHQNILPQLVEVCRSIHEKCGVVLIGSVARGTERADSDIDLNLIFPRDECPLNRSSYVEEDNRWQLRLKDQVEGIRIDVAWETQHVLFDRLKSKAITDCWPFSNGLILHDPCVIATPCLNMAKKWFAEHPDVTSHYQTVYAAAKHNQMRERGMDDVPT